MRISNKNISERAVIRNAVAEDAAFLTAISFESKRYWNYPEAYLRIWAGELTITPDYIKENDVVVIEHSDRIVGYYSIVTLYDDLDISGIVIGKGSWLEHMFITPDYIGFGIGTCLFRHMSQRCLERNINKLSILADPNAKGFYDKMGCSYIKEFPSTIINRTTPLFELHFVQNN